MFIANKLNCTVTSCKFVNSHFKLQTVLSSLTYRDKLNVVYLNRKLHANSTQFSCK